MLYNDTTEKYKCVGMSTSCTVTLNGNTDDASTKDDVGMSAKPTVISKSWQVQIESLNVLDAAAILHAIKHQLPFKLYWDETSTLNNQSLEGAGFARGGNAYLSDVTFNFNDRENSSKSLQFIGTGALTEFADAPSIEVYTPSDNYQKGQFIRLFLGSDNSETPAKVIASAKELSLHISLSLEDATTKDTADDWQVQEPTGLSYDITTTALMRGNDTITSGVMGHELSDVMSIYEASAPVKFQIAHTSGDNNRTKGTVIIAGSVVITSLALNGPNRQNADYTAQLNGYGAYEVPSVES